MNILLTHKSKMVVSVLVVKLYVPALVYWKFIKQSVLHLNMP